MSHTERIATDIVDAVFKIHIALGPGLLESAYEACLAHELTIRGHQVKRQRAQPVFYEGLLIDAGYRLDLVIDDEIILELKAVDQVLPVHQAQLVTYLKLSGKSLGFLSNFNVPLIKNGIKRFVVHHALG